MGIKPKQKSKGHHLAIALHSIALHSMSKGLSTTK